jgi:hypothetical protein
MSTITPPQGIVLRRDDGIGCLVMSMPRPISFS